MTPTAADFWFLPLGGTGEIGMNMNLYGHDDQWLMVDCGVTFATPDAPLDEPHIQMADPAFIADRREQLAGLVITHAHEDHIGAVAHLWPFLRCPVYTTPFTAEILRRKLVEAQIYGIVPVHVVPVGGHQQIGVFSVDWVTLTHSIPEPQALVISTPAGRAFHTADWKLDANPVLGPPYDPKEYARLGEQDIQAMICDSTNAMLPGHSESESELFPGLLDAVNAATGRVVVTCFASNLARLVTLSRVAEATNRHICLLGRSLRNMVSAATVTGTWPGKNGFVPPEHLGYLPRHAVMAIATGSQGESRAALAKLSRDHFHHMQLDEGDTVIFSARMIPGNEEAVETLIKRLHYKGVDVITADDTARPIHASGHPSQDELTAMYQWVKPRVAIPVHGEPPHLAANGQVAAEQGVPRQLIGRNGDLYFIAPVPGIRRGAVSTGRLGLIEDRLQPLVHWTERDAPAPRVGI